MLKLAAINFRYKALLWREKKKKKKKRLFIFGRNLKWKQSAELSAGPFCQRQLNKTFSQEWFCFCVKVVQTETIIHHFRAPWLHLITSMKVLISFHPVSSPTSPYYSHHVVHLYQTVIVEWVLVCHLRAIIKTAILPCFANELKRGNKKTQWTWFIKTSATVQTSNDGHKSTLTKS